MHLLTACELLTTIEWNPIFNGDISHAWALGAKVQLSGSHQPDDVMRFLQIHARKETQNETKPETTPKLTGCRDQRGVLIFFFSRITCVYCILNDLAIQWRSLDIADDRAHHGHTTFVRNSTQSAEAFRGLGHALSAYGERTRLVLSILRRSISRPFSARFAIDKDTIYISADNLCAYLHWWGTASSC